jgi:hypothetical protein
MDFVLRAIFAEPADEREDAELLGVGVAEAGDEGILRHVVEQVHARGG